MRLNFLFFNIVIYKSSEKEIDASVKHARQIREKITDAKCKLHQL